MDAALFSLAARHHVRTALRSAAAAAAAIGRLAGCLSGAARLPGWAVGCWYVTMWQWPLWYLFFLWTCAQIHAGALASKPCWVIRFQMTLQILCICVCVLHGNAVVLFSSRSFLGHFFWHISLLWYYGSTFVVHSQHIWKFTHKSMNIQMLHTLFKHFTDIYPKATNNYKYTTTRLLRLSSNLVLVLITFSSYYYYYF